VLLVWAGLVMAWDGGVTLAEQFASARATVTEMFPGLRRVGKSYQGFVKAMTARGQVLLEILATELRRQQRQLAPCWRVEGREAFAVDGSRVECPRTVANEWELKRAGRQKTGPQLSLTVIYHMGTGCVWDYRIGPGPESERIHLRAMLATLPAGATIVADAGFIGYDLLREILAGGRHVLFRVGSNVTLLKKLGYARLEQDATVYLWPEQARCRHQPPLVLRLTILRGPRHPVYVVTDVVSEAALAEEQISVLYRLRWGVEVFYRSLKQTLRQRKMRSASPHEAKRELAWAVAGLWVLSLRGAQVIVAEGKDPRNLSIAIARQQFRQAMAGRCRAGTDLTKQLANAVKDGYVRQKPKTARDWPHKKNDPPAGAPKINDANPTQLLRAKALWLDQEVA
jgi:hypothetical protein